MAEETPQLTANAPAAPTSLTPEPASAVPVTPADHALAALTQALELVEIGGPVVVILGLMSVFALSVILAKLVQFAAAATGNRRAARRAVDLYRQGRTGEAFETARTSRNPAAQVLALAMEDQARGIPEAKIREECYAEAQIRVEALRGWMRPLEVIGTLAPLLGLFGTVLGMIAAFSALEQAGSQVDPAILSGGIWEALLTTAVGLAVAVPTITAANWFERRIERVEHEIDTGLARLFAAEWSAAEAELPPAFAADRAPADRGSLDDAAPRLRPAAIGE
ncbi:MAG: MotA/TolQ/ExbB proton channel family protein [Pseudomonadota bacterium]